MELFWAHGYEGTSMADLTAAMGVAAPSLYAAFGGKEALFREAVERYARTDGRHTVDALCGGGGARDGVERMLLAGAMALTLEARPHGCLVVLGAAGGAPSDGDAHRLLYDCRARVGRLIRDRLALAVQSGELPAGTPTEPLAAFFETVLQGMSIQARDGASREQLEAVARTAMRAWPANP